MKKGSSVLFLVLIILFTIFFLSFIYINYFLYEEEIYTYSPPPVVKPLIKLESKFNDVTTEHGLLPFAFTSRSTPANQSNVVGYIAKGGFILGNVPEWIVQNWYSESLDDFGSISFIPRPEYASTTFSSIKIYIRPTSKTFNAKLLYEQALEEPLGGMFTSVGYDAVLNYRKDIIVYGTEKTKGDRTYASYYIDGNDKTAIITFDTDWDYINGTFLKLRDDFVKFIETGTGKMVELEE